MPTEKQREASRLNGAKSRGPVTPEGKARSSRNSWKHGLTSTVTAGSEIPEAYNHLAEQVYQECGGQGVIPQMLAEQIAAAYWQSHRARVADAAMFDQALSSVPHLDPGEAYAAAFVIADALKRSPAYTSKDVREALAATDLKTVFGPVKFQAYDKFTNQNKLPTYLVQWIDGKLELVWPKAVASKPYLYPVDWEKTWK